MKTHKKITCTERERLSVWKKEGLSNIDCAKRLGRSVSTIGRELKRNKTRVSVGWNNWEMIYEPVHADHVANERKRNAWFAKEPLKNKKIFSYVDLPVAMEKFPTLRISERPESFSGHVTALLHFGPISACSPEP